MASALSDHVTESITISLELILLVRLITRTVNFSLPLFLIPDQGAQAVVAKSPGDVPSMESIQQQQDGTDPNNTTQDE